MKKLRDKRKTLLNKIANYEGDLEAYYREIKSYEWDSEGAMFVLKKEHIKNVLSLFLESSISKQAVYRWADFFEMRDDVDYPESEYQILQKTIYELATPELEGDLDENRAREILSAIQ